ncbi:MAG: lysozyme family protein [Oscillospiraceae bacterium]|nr:lysozyme family protein [Oscillospiraceae bacterium]
MRREAIKDVRKEKAEAAQHGPQNVSHGETHSNASQPLQAPTPKERMRRQMVQEVKKRKAETNREQAKNLSHSETSFEVTEPSPAMPKEQMRQSYLHSQKRKQETARISDTPISEQAGNDLPTIQKRSTAVRQEQANNISQHRRTREDRKQITEQRQRALPRDTSSAGASKAQIVKEQGRRYARDQAVKEIKTSSAKGAAKAGNEFIQKLGAAISKAVRPSSDDLILYGGYALVIIVPLIMLAGIAVALFGSGEGRSSYIPVSAEVEAYTPIIQIYANQYGIPEYTELIKAVMMQESGGQGTDPMQASESGYNTRYPHAPNSITDPEYSIDVGVHTLADVLDMAGVESPIDLDHISLSLQGYNFGPGYISWALANYGGYSELNAIEFSDMMAAQYGWAGYGDKAYVSHVLRYYPVGRLYMGEGNAAMVAVAQSQIGNVGGVPYWSWWGLDYRVEWCAIFVSWCADQCGYLDAGVLPKMEGVRPYVDWFIERGQWQGREYEPSPGDIIFFDWESDGLADHVGIVEKVEDGLIYTVEGNSGDRCVENRYYLGSAPVYGFGLPMY